MVSTMPNGGRDRKDLGAGSSSGKSSLARHSQGETVCELRFLFLPFYS